MYIGEAAKRSGASQRAIRLYESLGLLTPSRAGRYRIYTEADLAFIKLIKQGQALGVQLAEMAQLMTERHSFDWPAVNRLLAQKLARIEAEQRRLRQQQRLIERYRDELERCSAGVDSDPGGRVYACRPVDSLGIPR